MYNMIDIAVAYNSYRFLGNEFLTWIWFITETDSGTISSCDDDPVELVVGNRMVLENRSANGVETITIKGDVAGLEEALLALQKGASVTDINLIYKSGSLQWQFSLKGESLNFSSFKLPETSAAENAEDLEGMVLDKIYLYDKPFLFLDRLYRHFLQLRLSEEWAQHQTYIQKWVNNP